MLVSGERISRKHPRTPRPFLGEALVNFPRQNSFAEKRGKAPFKERNEIWGFSLRGLEKELATRTIFFSLVGHFFPSFSCPQTISAFETHLSGFLLREVASLKERTTFRGAPRKLEA